MLVWQQYLINATDPSKSGWFATLQLTQSQSVSRVAVDGAGYIYWLAGNNANTITIAKISPQGDGVIWSKQLISSRNMYAGGIAVDAVGNVYVSGEDNTSSSDNGNAFVRAYSSDGTLLWNRLYGTTGPDGLPATDHGADIEVYGNELALTTSTDRYNASRGIWQRQASVVFINRVTGTVNKTVGLGPYSLPRRILLIGSQYFVTGLGFTNNTSSGAQAGLLWQLSTSGVSNYPMIVKGTSASYSYVHSCSSISPTNYRYSVGANAYSSSASRGSLIRHNTDTTAVLSAWEILPRITYDSTDLRHVSIRSNGNILVFGMCMTGLLIMELTETMQIVRQRTVNIRITPEPESHEFVLTNDSKHIVISTATGTTTTVARIPVDIEVGQYGQYTVADSAYRIEAGSGTSIVAPEGVGSSITWTSNSSQNLNTANSGVTSIVKSDL